MLCYSIVETPVHAYVSYPPSPLQIEDPLRNLCHIDARSGQFDAATMPSCCKHDSLIPGNLLQAEQSFALNDADLESM